ncbi:hypothetical protein [Pseudoalteromonas piscicida]
MEVNSTPLALKLAARKALIIRSSGYLTNGNRDGVWSRTLLETMQTQVL